MGQDKQAFIVLGQEEKNLDKNSHVIFMYVSCLSN